MTRHPDIDHAESLFQSWSSGDADAPAASLHPDGVLDHDRGASARSLGIEGKP